MSQEKAKIYLYHGESDYYVFRKLQEVKKQVATEQINSIELFGGDDLDFPRLADYLDSSDLFADETVVILRGVMDAKSFYPFVEKLTELFNAKKEFQNRIYIFQYGKVLKTSRFYKAVDKKGIITELSKPQEKDLVNDIKKSLQIAPDAAELLVKNANSDLFTVKNEIAKLKAYLAYSKKEKVIKADLDRLSIKYLNTTDVWGIGSNLIHCLLQKENANLKIQVLELLEECLRNNISAMQILYSFYQNVESAIYLKHFVNQKKSYKECLSLGYYFVKDFYSAINSISSEELKTLHRALLDYEFKLKNGEVDEVLGMKRIIVNL